MDTAYLKEFVVLAETKNFTKAAERLDTTQPILSKHIKALEDELGVPLFIHSKRQVELNEFGDTLRYFSNELLRLERDAILTLHQNQMINGKELVIGTIPSVSQYNLLDILTSFQALYPDTRFRFVEAESDALQEKLMDLSCDCAFIQEFEKENDNTYESISYVRDSLAAVLPSNHPLASCSSLSLNQLKDEAILLLKQDTVMQKMCINACRKSGFDPVIGYSDSRTDNILKLVSQNMGVSILAKHTIPLNSEGISIVDIAPPIYTQIKLVSLLKEYRSAITTRFMEFVRSLPPYTF